MLTPVTYSYTCGLIGCVLCFPWQIGMLRWLQDPKGFIQTAQNSCWPPAGSSVGADSQSLPFSSMWTYRYGYSGFLTVWLLRSRKEEVGSPQSSWGLASEDLECCLGYILSIRAVRGLAKNYRKKNYILLLDGRVACMYRDRGIDGSHLWRLPHRLNLISLLNGLRKSKRKLSELAYTIIAL